MTMQSRKEAIARYPVTQVMPITKGIDASSLDGSILKGFGRIRENIEIVGGKVKPLPPVSQITHSPHTNVTYTFIGGAELIRSTGKRYGFLAWDLPTSVPASAGLCAVNLGAEIPEYFGDISQDWEGKTLVEGREKVYAQGDPLSAVEWDDTLVNFKVGTVGLPRPTITSIAVHQTGAQVIKPGTYQYGIELVEMEGTVVKRSSGISRISTSTGAVTPLYNLSDPLCSYIKVIAGIPVGSSYTKIRLWRSKTNDIDPVTGLQGGTPSSLYLANSRTAAQYQADGYILDGLPDTALPFHSSVDIETLPTTAEVLDLVPGSFATKIGIVGAYKLFVSGVSDDPAGVYELAGKYATRYAEQFSYADRVGAVSGGKVLSLHGFGEDLIVRTEQGLWRLFGADISNPFIHIARTPEPLNDLCISVVQGEGLYIIGKDKKIGYLDTNYVWHISVRDGDTGVSAEKLLVDETSIAMSLSSETLRVIAGGKIYVLNPSGFFRQGDVGASYDGVWDGDNGQAAMTHVANDSLTLQYVGKGTTGYFLSKVTVGPFQPSQGDGIVEACSFLIEGESAGTLTLHDKPLEGDSPEIREFTHIQLGDSTFEFFLKDREPLPTRLSSQRLYATYTFSGALDSIVVKGLVQQGGAIPVSRDTDIHYQSDFLSGQVMRFTRPDPLVDYWGNGSLQ